MSSEVEFDVIENENDDFYSNDDLYNITSWGADLSFRELITMYEEGELLKPEMQRNYVWDKSEASRFIETILMGLPVPSIFLAKMGADKLIVDGYQRIMTVYDFVKGKFNKDESVFKLSNSNKINAKWRGKTFQQLTTDEQRKLKSTTIHSIIFEQKKPIHSDTSLYQVFERINTGGRSLMPQEIRNCVYHNEFNDLLIDLNDYKYWRELFGSYNKDPRMKDMEFILRFFALGSKQVLLEEEAQQISLKKELNIFMGDTANNQEEKIEEFRKKFTDMIKLLHSNLGENSFHNYSFENNVYISRFHPTIFDSIAIATSYALENNLITEENRRNLEDKKLELLKNPDFKEFISSRTTNIGHIKGRVKIAARILYDVEFE